MNALLPWAFLLPLPGMAATTLGAGRRAGFCSLLGPLAVLGFGLVWLLGDHAVLSVRIQNWLPLFGDGAFSLRLDALAAVMLAVVGAVASCVYVFSLSYMREDPSRRRFFALLDFFVAAMCLLVLAGNVVVLLLGWAGVGLASFLLISFWREKEGTLGAGLQALAANAIGDAALLLVLVALPAGAGELATLHTADLGGVAGGPATIPLLIVIAAAAKSAQGPLYFWLPSAMAGPTPVSALIHAATMVAAGVYLLCRTHGVLAQSPTVLTIVAWTGLVTALLAAVASLQQRNYKRGLAYSTLSQLGYMFAAIGCGAPFAAFFHLFTHASFKALLFLVAGVVIHANDGEEDLANLGGQRRHLPQAAVLALIGSLALIGLPVLTAGAFSKDLVLEAALDHDALVGWLLVGGVVLTGLYTGRLWFAVFGAAAARAGDHGHGNGNGNGHHPGHAPDASMLAPLVVLAIGSIGLGWLGPWLGDLLTSLLGVPPAVHAWSTLGAIAGGLGLLGFVLAGLWVKRAGSGAALPPFGIAWVDGTAAAVAGAARRVASLHDGRLGGYLSCSLIGAAVVVLLSLLRS